MQQINLIAVPSQSMTFTIGNVRWSLTIKEARGAMICDVAANGETVITGTRIVAGQMIIPYQYREDGGNFLLMGAGDEEPNWQAFGISQALYFLDADELGAIRADN